MESGRDSKGRGNQSRTHCWHVAGLNTCLFLTLPLHLGAYVVALSPSMPTRATLSGYLNPEICGFHPYILPPTSLPRMTYPFTHPIHPSTHPPLSSHPFQPATCTIERQTVEHSRGSSRATWVAAWRLLQVAYLRAWPQALEPQESALVSWVLRRFISLRQTYIYQAHRD